MTGRFQPLAVGKSHRGSGAADSGIGGSTYSGRNTTTTTTTGSSGISLMGTSLQHEVNTSYIIQCTMIRYSYIASQKFFQEKILSISPPALVGINNYLSISFFICVLEDNMATYTVSMKINYTKLIIILAMIHRIP